jgi:hypothetical protein
LRATHLAFVADALHAYLEATYDKRGMVTQIERKDSSNTLLQSQENEYDARGRLWQVTELYKDPGQTCRYNGAKRFAESVNADPSATTVPIARVRRSALAMSMFDGDLSS